MSTYFLVNLRSKLSANHIKSLSEVSKSKFPAFARLFFTKCAFFALFILLGSLSSEEIVRKRNRIFDFEQKKQRDNVGRIEKIEVRYLGNPKDETMILNKDLSTPFNCAQREDHA